MRLWIQSSATRSGAAVIDAAGAEGGPSRRARCTCLRTAIRASSWGVSGTRQPGPLLRGGSEAVGRGQGDVLGRTVRLGQDPVPERLRRALEVLELRHSVHTRSFAIFPPR